MEQMTITVTMETAQAMAAATGLAAAIAQLRQEAEKLGAAVDVDERNLGRFAGTAQEATPQVTSLAKATEQASSNTASYTQNVVNATKNVTNFQQLNVTQTINNIHGATEKLNTSTSALAGNVKRMVEAWAGIQSIFNTVKELTDRLDRVRQAGQELAGGKLDFDQSTAELVTNLHLSGPGGERQALSLIKGVQSLSGSSIANAQAAIITTNNVRGHANTIDDQKYAAELASFAETNKVDPEAMGQFARRIAQSGATTPEAFRQMAAETMAGFRTSVEKDINAYLRGAVGVIGDEAARDPAAAEGSAALYAAMASRTRNTRQAAMETREIYDLAVGTSPKSRQFLADEAVRLGIVKADVSDADFESAVARGEGPEAREIRGDRERYVTEHGRMTADEKRWQDHMAVFRRRNSPQKVADEEAVHAAQMAERRRSLDDLDRKVSEAEAKLRHSLGTASASQQVARMAIQERVDRLVLPAVAAAAGNPEAMQRLTDASGGEISRFEAANLIATPQGLADIERARQAIRGASGDDIAADHQRFLLTDRGKEANLDAQLKLNAIESTTPGMMYMRRVAKEAAQRNLQRAAHGDYVRDTKLSEAELVQDIFRDGESRQVSQEAYNVLLRDMERVIADPTVNRSDKQRVIDLRERLKKEHNSPLNLSTKSIDAMLNNIGTAFGDVQTVIDQDRSMRLDKWQQQQRDGHSSGADFGPPAPTTRPTTRPVHDGGHAAVYNYNQTYVTTHQGVVMTHDDEIEDLPGRGEGWFG